MTPSPTRRPAFDVGAADVEFLKVLFHSDLGIAREAWGKWRPRWDPNSPSDEEFRLYPLLAERVPSIEPAEPMLPMLKGVRRQSSARTLLLLNQLTSALAVLEGRGIEAVVLKGAALSLSVYTHIGDRPFHDLDILVDPREFEAALSALREDGWSQRYRDFPWKHAVSLRREGFQLDVHRKPFKELVLIGRPRSGWELTKTRAAPRVLEGGRRVQIQEPADALLHAIAHGTQATRETLTTTSLRWIGDAKHLIASGEVDWERVDYLSRLFEMGPLLQEMLGLVSFVSGVEFPMEQPKRTSGAVRKPSIRRRAASFHHFPNKGGPGDVLRLGASSILQETLDLPAPLALIASIPIGARMATGLAKRSLSEPASVQS